MSARHRATQSKEQGSVQKRTKEEDLVLDPKKAIAEGKQQELEEQREELRQKPSEAKKYPQEERTVSW
jgi:hypothetical protein